MSFIIVILFIFCPFHSGADPIGCYVSNYSCSLYRPSNDDGKHSNILSCTTTRSQACFPAFGHPSVRVINTSMGRIHDVNIDTFDYRQVDVLNVHADLTQIPSHALRYMSSLESLTIDRGPQLSSMGLISIDIDADAFEFAHNLRHVTFQHVDFSSLHRRRRKKMTMGLALRKAETLKRLIFDQCQFDHLGKHFFGDQYITELIITNSVVLEGGGFTMDSLDGYSQSLDRLIIKDTNLQMFPSTIRRLYSLTKLVLSGCNLKYIPDDAFSSSPSSSNSADSIASSRLLQELDFSFNRLETIGMKALRSLVDLSLLNLEGNPTLASVPSGLFLENRLLKSINLRGCTRLRSLTMEQLRGLEKSLLRLSLHNCHSLTVLQVNRLSRLRELDLRGCGIKELRKGMFGRQRFTDGLLLDGNPLDTIEPGAFEGVDLTRSWSLKNTHMKIIDLSLAFQGVGSLTRLELKQNLMLTNVTVSDQKKVPPTLLEIKLISNGNFQLSDSSGRLRSFLLERKDAKIILGGTVLCSCEWHWMRQEVRKYIDFQDGGGNHPQGWTLWNDETARCCNAVVRKGTNDTSPLYASSFLESWNQYCEESAPNRDRLVASCNLNSASLIDGRQARNLVVMSLVLLVQLGFI